MDNYKVLKIAGCRHCPLMNDEHLYCSHPHPLPIAPEFAHLTPAQCDGREEAPSWCPLRSSALLIDLVGFQ